MHKANFGIVKKVNTKYADRSKKVEKIDEEGGRDRCTIVVVERSHDS